MREAELIREIEIELSKLPNVQVYRNNTGEASYVSAQGKAHRVVYGVGGKGAPDLMVFIGPNGRTVGLECKSADGRVRPVQAECHARLSRVGVRCFVVRDVAAALRAVEIQPSRLAAVR